MSRHSRSKRNDENHGAGRESDSIENHASSHRSSDIDQHSVGSDPTNNSNDLSGAIEVRSKNVDLASGNDNQGIDSDDNDSDGNDNHGNDNHGNDNHGNDNHGIDSDASNHSSEIQSSGGDDHDAGSDKHDGGSVDILHFENGNDLLTGNSGSDTFDLGAGQGNDYITNFDTSLDHVRILMGTNGMTTADEVQAHLGSDNSGNAVLDLGDGNSLTFIGVHAAELSGSDFTIGS